MVYRRKGRPGFTFSGRTRTGWEEIGTGPSTPKPMCILIAQMWEKLASTHRAWDLLQPVLDGGRRRPKLLLALYDDYAALKGDVEALRRRSADIDLEPLVEDWRKVHGRNVKADSAEHAEHHVRALLPEGVERKASSITTEVLTAALYAYPGKRNTVRKVHSSWSMFFLYCTKIRKCWPVNPMDDVPRPVAQISPVRFYEEDVVDRIVAWQPDDDRRGFFALSYGAAIDVSTQLLLVVSDVHVKDREIRAAGTKTSTRDRVVAVADWAWPFVLKLLRGKMANARLFPEHWTRYTVSDWHRETVDALKLPRYPLHSARDHWAVRAVRGGTPIRIVAEQLGHGSPELTFKKYGRFSPNAEERRRWERRAAKEAERRRNG